MPQCKKEKRGCAYFDTPSMEPRMGQPIQTPKDFEYLAACIVDRLHQSVSPFTLKRVWNYITTDCGLSQISDLAHYRL